MAELEDERAAGAEEGLAATATIHTATDATGMPVISVSGELDISNADTLEATVALLAAERPDGLIFELSGLRFMDSAGIAVLLGAAAKVNAVHVRDPSPAVRRVVELTGLADVLTVEP
jgi:anti-sigma B factor antagonist